MGSSKILPILLKMSKFIEEKIYYFYLKKNIFKVQILESIIIPNKYYIYIYYNWTDYSYVLNIQNIEILLKNDKKFKKLIKKLIFTIMIKEFPQKWAIVKCPMINEYLNENSVRKEETIYEEEEGDEKLFVHFPAFKENRGKNEDGEERGEKLYHISDKLDPKSTSLNSTQTCALPI